jgi:hypothetical protein
MLSPAEVALLHLLAHLLELLGSRPPAIGLALRESNVRHRKCRDYRNGHGQCGDSSIESHEFPFQVWIHCAEVNIVYRADQYELITIPRYRPIRVNRAISRGVVV